MISPGFRPPHYLGLRSTRRQSGFSLLELGLALLCLAMIGYLAVSEIRKFQHRAHCDQFATEVRELAAIFETHFARKSEWPAATTPEARLPRGMESTLAGTSWLKGPPFGGSYDWIPPARPEPNDEQAGKKPAAGGMIAVTAFSPHLPLPLSIADLRAIDAKLDDGNLATGRFRTGFNGWPVYMVAPNR